MVGVIIDHKYVGLSRKTSAIYTLHDITLPVYLMSYKSMSLYNYCYINLIFAQCKREKHEEDWMLYL